MVAHSGYISHPDSTGTRQWSIINNGSRTRGNIGLLLGQVAKHLFNIVPSYCLYWDQALDGRCLFEITQGHNLLFRLFSLWLVVSILILPWVTKGLVFDTTEDNITMTSGTMPTLKVYVTCIWVIHIHWDKSGFSKTPGKYQTYYLWYVNRIVRKAVK